MGTAGSHPLAFTPLKGGCSKDGARQENTVGLSQTQTPQACAPSPEAPMSRARSSCFQRVQAKRPGGNTSELGGCGTARGGRGRPHALVPGNRRGRSNLHRHRHPSLSVKSSHMALLTGKPGVSPSFKIDFWFRSVFGIIHPFQLSSSARFKITPL